MNYDIQTIGQKLKQARKRKRYTQEYVSARADIGVKFLSQIECGKAGLSVQTLLALCDILEVSPNYVLLCDEQLRLLDPQEQWVSRLSPKQRKDAEQILQLFARNCLAQE